MGGGREPELVFKWSPPGKLPARVSGPWVRARGRGHGIKRLEGPDSTQRVAAFRNSDLIKVGYSQNQENQLCIYNLHRPVIKATMAVLMNYWMCLLALSLTVTSSHALKR